MLKYNGEIQRKDREIQQKDAELQSKDIEIQRTITEIQRKDELQQKSNEMLSKDTEILQKNAELQKKDIEIQSKLTEIQQKDDELQWKRNEMLSKDTEIQQKDAELHRKEAEIQKNYNEVQQLTTALLDKNMMLETLRSDMSTLENITHLSVSKECTIYLFTIITCLMFQVNKSSGYFWNSLKLTWQQCADLPSKYFATSVAELDGKVYITTLGSRSTYSRPLIYDSKNNQWSSLPPLPFVRFSLVSVDDKKQLLAIGGVVDNNGVIEISSKVFLWNQKKNKWTTPYPNMPTGRFHCSSVSHGSTVIVAGGVTSWDPWTMTRAVEVLHIDENFWFTNSYWSVVKQLPHVVWDAIPLLVNNKLYIAAGYDKGGSPSTCNVVTASLYQNYYRAVMNTLAVVKCGTNYLTCLTPRYLSITIKVV